MQFRQSILPIVITSVRFHSAIIRILCPVIVAWWLVDRQDIQSPMDIIYSDVMPIVLLPRYRSYRSLWKDSRIKMFGCVAVYRWSGSYPLPPMRFRIHTLFFNLTRVSLSKYCAISWAKVRIALTMYSCTYYICRFLNSSRFFRDFFFLACIGTGISGINRK